jgi:hypothetical protein
MMAKKKAAKKNTTVKKKATAKKTMVAKGKSAPKKKAAPAKKAKATAKKPAKAAKAAKRIAKKPIATPSNLTVERVNVRPMVRVSRVEIRLTAKAPVMPASFRPAPAIGVLLPPPSREE